MMTQGLTPDPQGRLIILSFLTLSHLLDRLICTRNILSIVLLLQMMQGWERWGVVDFCQGVSGWQRSGCHLIVLFFASVFVFCSLTFSVPLFSRLEHDGCYICFFVCFFILFVSGPFNSELLMHRNCCVCYVKPL